MGADPPFCPSPVFALPQFPATCLLSYSPLLLAPGPPSRPILAQMRGRALLELLVPPPFLLLQLAQLPHILSAPISALPLHCLPPCLRLPIVIRSLHACAKGALLKGAAGCQVWLFSFQRGGTSSPSFAHKKQPAHSCEGSRSQSPTPPGPR